MEGLEEGRALRLPQCAHRIFESCRMELLSADGAVALPPAPLSLPQEEEPGYSEGQAIELGRADRLVCGVVGTDYLSL